MKLVAEVFEVFCIDFSCQGEVSNAIGDVLILANVKAAANAAKFKYVPEAITMNKVDVTVANQQSGLLVRGTVNESVMPYPIDKDLKATLGFIRFV